ncbi:MAG: hypothetical protein R2774_02030 [Saprospiraceae bacterium]
MRILYKFQHNHYTPAKDVLQWLADLFFYIIDILAVPELYQLVTQTFKYKTRGLNAEELKLTQYFFKDSLMPEFIKVDNTAHLLTHKIAIAYVGFNTINYKRKLKNSVFIHELVHIWQYQRYGTVYMGRAISAQRSKEGYDYGGVSKLYQSMIRGKRLEDFNFEQQAEIIEDYYKITTSPFLNGDFEKMVYSYYYAHLFY